MNFRAATFTTQTENFSQSVTRSMHLHRHAQFRERLNWSLPSENSQMEKDQFDDGNSNYTIISQGREHFGSFRLRNATDGTMIEQCFLEQLPQTVRLVQENRARIIEITRLVSSPTVSPRERKRVCGMLLEALRGALLKRPEHFFVAVVSAPILRLLFCRKVRFKLYERGVIDESMAASVILEHGAFVNCSNYEEI